MHILECRAAHALTHGDAGTLFEGCTVVHGRLAYGRHAFLLPPGAVPGGAADPRARP